MNTPGVLLMKELNKIRLLAGIPIDGNIETTVTEARHVPSRREHLTPKNRKSMEARVSGAQSAMKHVQQAIAALEKIPAVDYHADIQHFITELEYVLRGDETSPGGLTQLLNTYQKESRSHVRAENAKQREEEEALAATLPDESDMEDEETMESLAEAKKCAEEDEEKADKDYDEDGKIESSEEEHKGVVDKAIKKEKDDDDSDDGDDDSKKEDDKSDDDKDEDKDDEMKESYYYDEKESDSSKVEDKDESPNQLDALGDQSDTEMSDKIKVPNGVKQALKVEIDQARKEAKKLGVSATDAKNFYENLATAFEELLTHLEKGTVHDIKQAQIFWSSLMGPILHKVPKVVSDFIVNGGQRKSLKSHMKEIK